MSSHYNDSPEAAGVLAKSAIPLASKLGLPITPHIYEVCYLYSARRNKKLCEAFEDLLAKEPKPDKFMVEALYYEYILDEDNGAIQVLQDAVETLMNSTEGVLKEAQDNTSHYGDSLQIAATELQETSLSADSLKELVTRLVADTTQMRTSTAALQAQLSDAHAEVAELQSEYAKIREESLTDPLTGLKNRRAFDDALAGLTSTAKSSGTPMCLLVIDIDHFKRVNDTFGHAIGDAVIKCVAKIIKNSVRGDDISARFGGEEFVVLLPDTPQEGAKKVAEKIRTIVENQKLRHSNVDLGQITISIGLAQLSQDEETKHFFERADSALYDAKNSGRNQTCIK